MARLSRRARSWRARVRFGLVPKSQQARLRDVFSPGAGIRTGASVTQTYAWLENIGGVPMPVIGSRKRAF